MPWTFHVQTGPFTPLGGLATEADSAAVTPSDAHAGLGAGVPALALTVSGLLIPAVTTKVTVVEPVPTQLSLHGASL
jgi:hypothetical protein